MSDWKNVQYKNGKYRTSEGGGGGGSTFAGLDDVSFSDLQNGQVPKYNSTTQKWENADESGGGGTVTDVKVDGQSVVDPQTGAAEITMPNIPVQDVTVDGTSVVNQQGVAEITMPTPPTIPVTDVKVNGTSVVDGNKEAQIKSYKEVTQSEYNALPASKTSDDILYCIKDAGGADGFPPLIYSDEEREIGVWRDGKPLYQKTIIDTTSRSIGTNYLSTGISNIDNIAEIKGVISYGGNDYLLTIPFSDDPNSSISNSHIKFSSIYRSNGVITFYIGSDFTGANAVNKVIVTIQYTKTTDTPGSSIWTPFDVVNHKILNAYGQIVKSENYSNVSAVGGVTVNLSGNLAELDFCFQVTSAGGSANDFAWGLSVDKIRELNANIPNLKPIQGGNFFCTQSNQSSLVGYGSLMSPSVPDYKYWLPARLYTVNADIGGWPSSELYLGGYWFGRCYAEILQS